MNAILATLSASAGITRKQLFDNLTGNGVINDVEPQRLALASDLRWLLDEGYVIEFNDGSLDLPRTKSKPQDVVLNEAALSSPPVKETQLALATSRALTVYSPQS